MHENPFPKSEYSEIWNTSGLKNIREVFLNCFTLWPIILEYEQNLAPERFAMEEKDNLSHTKYKVMI